MAIYGQAIYGQAVYGAAASTEKRHMSKFKRDVKIQPVTGKTALGLQVEANCTGNTEIGTVTTELADFIAANTALEAKNTVANQKRQESIQATTELDNADADWNAKLEKFMAKVEGNTDHDKAKMETTGLPTYEPGNQSPSAPPAQVQNLQASTGDNPGQVDLQWNSMKPKPRLFETRYCKGLTLDETKMVPGESSTTSKVTQGGLESAADYLFQVRGVGTGATRGPWSDPAKGRAA